MSGLWVPVRLSLICLLIGLAAVEGKAARRKDVGGTKVDITEYPWQAALYLNNKFACAATIIGERHVLTSSVFVYDYVNATDLSDLTVVVGTARQNIKSGEKFGVQSIKVHPGFVLEPILPNDLVLLKLSTAIHFDATKAAVPLPDADVPVGATVTTTGWGLPAWSTFSEDLKKHDLQIMANSECDKVKLEPGQEGYEIPLLDSQVCTLPGADGWDCQGNMGGPLVYKGVLVGINSWVNACFEGSPAVYSRIYKYVDWIRESVKEF